MERGAQGARRWWDVRRSEECRCTRRIQVLQWRWHLRWKRAGSQSRELARSVLEMFADLDETIRQLLIHGVPLDLSEVDVSFDAPDREWSGRLSRPTVNCFLYDVRENLEMRQT